MYRDIEKRYKKDIPINAREPSDIFLGMISHLKEFIVKGFGFIMLGAVLRLVLCARHINGILIWAYMLPIQIGIHLRKFRSQKHNLRRVINPD
jgi:hypothetical protein